MSATQRRDNGRATRRLTAVAVTCAISLQTVGCANEPFEVTLPYAIPHRYEAAKSTRPTNVSRWWTRYGSTELNALMDLANAQNFDIAIAVAQLEEASAQAQIAGAALWPTLNYSENNSRSQSSGTGTPGVISPQVTRDSFSKQLNASYVLDIWGQNRDAVRATLHTASASAYQVEVVRLTTRAAIVNNFLLHAANRERVKVATENLANAERVLRIIKDRQAAGTVSALETAQQTTLVENQRAAIPSLRQAAELSRTALALLTGRPAQTVHLKTNRARTLRVPEVSPGLPVSLLSRRPDVHSAEEQLFAAGANVDVARKAFLPTITLTGQSGFQSALLSTLLRPESFVYTIAAGATQPIFEGGRLRGQLALTEAQQRQFLETYRRSIVSALTDVEIALIAIRESAARETAQRRAVAAARLAFVLSEERLTQGTIDLTTLLTTQNTLFQAEDALIQVRLLRLQAAASLFQALGGDWDETAAGLLPVQ